MKILLVEDEPKVASFIKKGLEEQLFHVDVSHDGLTGKHMALLNSYDLMILDLNLPQLSGIEVCKIVRSKKKNMPILMLTALGTTDDKVIGLDSGADDYLVKPFEFKELMARIRALTRRSSEENDQEILSIADLELNVYTKNVKRAGKKIDLTAKEFTLLEYMLRNRGRVISRADIAEKVWDITFDTGTNVIDVYINFLRKKVDKEFPVKLIHTQIGMGYVLREEE